MSQINIVHPGYVIQFNKHEHQNSNWITKGTMSFRDKHDYKTNHTK